MAQDEQRRRDPVRDFFGGSPLGVIMRLLATCLLVGLIMTWLGLSPLDLVRSFEITVREAWANSGALIRSVLGYVLTGAVIVIPIWLVMRVFRIGRRR